MRKSCLTGGEIETKDETKFSQSQIPGGETYRELLFTFPVTRYKSQYRNETGRRQKLRGYSKGQQFFVGEYPIFEKAQAAKQESNDRPHTYGSPHWSEFNVLAHVRFNERTGT